MYYLETYWNAQECEGRPHRNYFDTIEASSKKEAIDKAIEKHYPHSIAHGKNKKAEERDWTKVMLRAYEIKRYLE